MKKLLYMCMILNSFATFHAMEITPVILGQKHIVKFLNIVEEHRFFGHAVPYIKQLANKKPEWKAILDDEQATGELITYRYENYEKNHTYMRKAEMASLLGTKGAIEWCKNYLLTNEREVQCLKKQLLRAAENDDRETISVILNVGIDVNATDPGSIEDGSKCRIGGFNPMLISAIERYNIDLVTFLLIEKHANPNIRAKKDELTPLILSIQLLHKAEQNKQYKDFYTHFSIINLLMKHSLLDLDAVDNTKKTALQYAIAYNMEWLQAMICLKNSKFFN